MYSETAFFVILNFFSINHQNKMQKLSEDQIIQKIEAEEIFHLVAYKSLKAKYNLSEFYSETSELIL